MSTISRAGAGADPGAPPGAPGQAGARDRVSSERGRQRRMQHARRAEERRVDRARRPGLARTAPDRLGRIAAQYRVSVTLVTPGATSACNPGTSLIARAEIERRIAGRPGRVLHVGGATPVRWRLASRVTPYRLGQVFLGVEVGLPAGNARPPACRWWRRRRCFPRTGFSQVTPPITVS